MGIGCVLLLWTALAAIAAIVGVAGVFVLGWGRYRRRHSIFVLGGVTAAVAGLVAVAATLFVLSWVAFGSRAYKSTSLSAFEDEFGVVAPNDVASVQLQASGTSDSTSRFLRFSASPKTIEAVVRGRFSAVTPDECETQFHALRNPPEWWRPVVVNGARCYAAERFDNAFATTNAWLLYDETSHVAHYYYIGID